MEEMDRAIQIEYVNTVLLYSRLARL